MFSAFSANSSTRAATIAWAAVFFVLAVAATLARGPWDTPLLIDNQHYFYMAERAASGVSPHDAHFDPKTTLSLLISAAAIKTGRLLGIGTDLDAARAISVVFAGLSASLVWLCAWLLTRSRIAAHSAAITIIGTPLFLSMALMGARPKVFMVPFLVAPVIATVKRRPFWSGFFSACAFLCWQPALLVIAGAVAALLLRPRTALRNLVLLSAGAVVPVLAYEGYYWAHGGLAEQLEQSFYFPSTYMTHPARSSEWWLHAKWIFGWGSAPRVRSVYANGFVLVLALALGNAVSRPRYVLKYLRENPGWCHVLVVAPAALLFTLHDYQGFPDGFILTPWIALAWGAATAALAHSARAKAVRPAVRAALVALVVAAAALPTVFTLGPHLRGGLDRQYALASEVEQYFQQGKRVYVVGCTHLLGYLRRANHVRYGFFFRGTAAYLRTKTNSPDGYRPLDEEGRMPDVILVSRGFVPDGQPWLEVEYQQRESRSFAAQGIAVYERVVPARYWGEPPLSGEPPDVST